MFPLLWWLIWIALFALPVTGRWIKNKWRYISLGAAGALFGFIAIAAVTIDIYMVLWLVFFKLSITAAEWLFAYMNVFVLSDFESRSVYEKYEGKRMKAMLGLGDRKEQYKWLTVFALIAIIVFSGVMLWQTQAVAGVNNASFSINCSLWNLLGRHCSSMKFPTTC